MGHSFFLFAGDVQAELLAAWPVYRISVSAWCALSRVSRPRTMHRAWTRGPPWV